MNVKVTTDKACIFVFSVVSGASAIVGGAQVAKGGGEIASGVASAPETAGASIVITAKGGIELKKGVEKLDRAWDFGKKAAHSYEQYRLDKETFEDIEGASKSNNPIDYLNKAKSNQGLSTTPARMKETWIEGDYKYTVRIHEGNSQYTQADSIYRVSRKSTVLDANGQGRGLEYLGTDGKWYPESCLKEFFKDGSKNPLFNENASKITHIPVN